MNNENINTFVNRLNNIFSKTKRFIENINFIYIKTGISNNIIYILNYTCHKKIAMTCDSDSNHSDIIRMYLKKSNRYK